MMDLVDIGGGFSYVVPDSGGNFNEVAYKISSLVNELFPDKNIRIIAEPGRYISESVSYCCS